MSGGRHSYKALRYFTKLSDREHAIFEAGIALASIFHQLVGMPLDINSIKEIEKALSNTFSSQPFRKTVEIRIREDYVKRGFEEPYDYGVITPESLDVRVLIEYGEARVLARLNWIDDIGYPLMYVEKVT
ncbi:MAG: dihydroneopterin aldolase family protein [Candidatus Caldarchaeales archaeon]